MAKLLVVATLICLLRSFLTSEATAPAADDARQEFTALCGAWAAVTSALKMPFDAQPVPSEFQDIINFNTSVSSAEWKQQIKEIKDAKGLEAFKKKDVSTWGNLGWDNLVDDWLAAFDAVSESGSPWNKEHQRPPDALPPDEIRHAINHSAQRAVVKKQKIQAAANAVDGTPLKDKYTAKIKEALCGADKYKAKDDLGTCTDITGTPAKDTVCTQANNGQAIVLDLLCVCANHDQEVCKPIYKAGLINAANLQTNALTSATACCPQKSPSTSAVADLQSALATVRVLVGKDKDAAAAVGVLGKVTTAATDCTHSSNGGCVNYAKYYAKPHSGFTSIPWVKAFDDAMAYYSLFQVQKQAAKQAANEIEDLKALVQAEYIKPMTPLLTTRQQKPTDKPEATVIPAKCTHKNKTADECPNDHCDYDAKIQECKPKTETEATAAGTGTSMGRTNRRMCKALQ